MSLHFQNDEDALFLGLEAEGRHKGLPTLFVVGTPPLAAIVTAMQAISARYPGGFGLYIGAGGVCDRILSAEALDEALKVLFSDTQLKTKSLFSTTHEYTHVFTRVAIESLHSHLIASSSLYAQVIEHWCKPLYIDWIVPLIWGTTLTEEKNIQSELSQFVASSKCNNSLNVHIKVYAPGVLFTVPIADCYFADFDNNKEEYQTDALLWSSKEKAL